MRAKMPYFLHIALTYLFQVSPDNLKHKFNDYASNISRTEINVDLLHKWREYKMSYLTVNTILT